jgi:hypothetical protein
VTASFVVGGECRELHDIGKRVAAHLERAAKYDGKAEDHRIAAGQLLGSAKELCEGGFKAFREKYCPHLGQTRAYELLAIASGKRTIEDQRADNAERNRQHREKKKAAAFAEAKKKAAAFAERFRHVTESDSVAATESRPTAKPPKVTLNGLPIKIGPEHAALMAKIAQSDRAGQQEVPAEQRRAEMVALDHDRDPKALAFGGEGSVQALAEFGATVTAAWDACSPRMTLADQIMARAHFLVWTRMITEEAAERGLDAPPLDDLDGWKRYAKEIVQQHDEAPDAAYRPERNRTSLLQFQLERATPAFVEFGAQFAALAEAA